MGKKAKQKELNKVKISRYVAIGAWAAPITVLLEIIKDIVDALINSLAGKVGYQPYLFPHIIIS